MRCTQAVPPGITIKKDVHMNKLPNAVKWLIVLAVLGAMGALMWKVNDRASRVEMPGTGQHLRHLPQCKLDLGKKQRIF